MAKPVVLCDVDGVLADFIGGVCERLNADPRWSSWLVPFRPSAFDTFDVKDALTQAQYEVFLEAWSEPGFCSSLKWYPGAKEFLRGLMAKTDLYCVTAPGPAATWDHERREWLSEIVPASRVIFCESAAKCLIKGDVLIEDSKETVEHWVSRTGEPAVLMSRPWNNGPFDVGMSDPVPERAMTHLHAIRILEVLGVL